VLSGSVPVAQAPVAAVLVVAATRAPAKAAARKALRIGDYFQ